MRSSLTACYLLTRHQEMMNALANGSWLTAERMRAAAVISGAVTILLLLFLFLTASGTVDAYGRPLGTDFSNVWTAGSMAREGAAASAWDWPSHLAVQQQVHGRSDIPFYGWHYPPPFLLLAAALAFLPYKISLIAWQATTLATAASILWRILPSRRALLLGLTAPVVFVCLGHGHNGFLTASLLGGGLLLLERRPILAGLLLGCLVYKPQFALFIPPLLLACRNWRAIAGAAASTGCLIALTFAFWGWPVWQAFLDSLPLTRTVIIEQGATGWEKIQSPFAMIRMWHGSVAAAYAVQAGFAFASVLLTLLASRGRDPSARNAAATATAMLSTPYVLDYDFVVLGLGAAFLVADGMKRGFLSWEKSLLALVWFAPLVARQLAEITLLPLGQLSAVIVLALAVRRSILLDEVLPAAFRSWPFRRSRERFGQ